MSMEKDDKIAFAFLLAIIFAVTAGVLFSIRWFFAGVLGLLDLETGGIGWRSAFISSIVLSFVFMVIFAIVAGDGVLGELGIMVVGFFVMVLFFTVSIAIIL